MARKKRGGKRGKANISKVLNASKEEGDDVPVSDEELSIVKVTSDGEDKIDQEEKNDTQKSQNEDISSPLKSSTAGSEELATQSPSLRRTSRRLKKTPVPEDYLYTGVNAQVTSTPIKIEKCEKHSKVIIERLEDSAFKSKQVKVESIECDPKQEFDVDESKPNSNSAGFADDGIASTSVESLKDSLSKSEEKIDETCKSEEDSNLSAATNTGETCISSPELEDAKKLKVTSPTANKPASLDANNPSILKEITTLENTDIHDSPTKTSPLNVVDSVESHKSPSKEESKSDSKERDLPEPFEKVNTPDTKEGETEIGFNVMEDSPKSPAFDLLHIEDELIYEEFQLENTENDFNGNLSEFNTNKKKESLHKVGHGALDDISDDELNAFNEATSGGIEATSQSGSKKTVSSQKRDLIIRSGVITKDWNNKERMQDGSKQKITETTENVLPGQSYIICIVDPSVKEISLSDKSIVFDCVACHFSNKEHTSNAWEHGNSKRHILKVMEIEYPKLYDLYKEDKAVNRLTLRNVMLNSEEKQKSLVIASESEYALKKSIIYQKKIDALLQYKDGKGGINHSAKLSTEVKEEAKPSTTDKVSILHEEEERLKLEALSAELAQEQKTRSYQRILIVMDQKDVDIQSNIFGKYVKVLRRANLSFDNALETLKEDEWFGKGTLYVFLCGLHSLICSKPHTTCIKASCPNPVEISFFEKNLPSYILISKVLKLHKSILDATESDLALFCDLLPVNIDKSNIMALDKRPCQNIHTIDFHRRIPVYITNLYLDCVREYNKFVDAHSQASGFEFWDLTKSTFSITTDDLKGVIERLDMDGVSLTGKHYQRRVSTITYNVCMLVRKIGNKEEKDYDDEFSSQPSKMTMNKEVIQKIIGISSDGAVPRQYDKAVILVDHINEAAVKKYFVGTKIIAVPFHNMDIEVVKSTIKSKVLEMPTKTLWIFLVGCSLVTDIKRCTACSPSCSSGLQSLTPKKCINSAQDVSMVVTNTFNSIRKFHDQLKSIIRPESDFIVIPSIPLAIYVEKEFGHDFLHSIQGTNFSFVTAAENNITLIQHLLTEFSKESINICTEMLKEIHCTFNSINDYERSLSNSHVQIMRKMENPSDVHFTCWKMTISKLFYYLLSKKMHIKLESIDEANEKAANCTEDLLVSESMVFSDDESQINDSENKDNLDSKSESTIPIPDEKFESIVFVSVGGQRNPFQISGNNIYSSKLELPIKNKDLLGEFSYLMEPNKKTLFVLIGDISLAGNQKISTTCEEQKCKKPINCICLDGFNTVVEESINMLKDIKEKLKSQFLGDECEVIIGPIWPRFVVRKFSSQNSSIHESEHNAESHSSFPCFLDANEDRLEEAISVFKSKWNEELNLDMNTLNHEVKDLLAKYLKKNIPLIEFKTLKQSSLDEFSLVQVQYRSFWRSFIDSVLFVKKNEDVKGVIQRLINRSTSQLNLNIPNQNVFSPIISPHQNVSPSDQKPVVSPFQPSTYPTSFTPCPPPSQPPPAQFMNNSTNFMINYPPPPYNQQFGNINYGTTDNSGNVNYGIGYGQSQFNNYQQPPQLQNNSLYGTTTQSSFGVPPVINAQQSTSNVPDSARTNLSSVSASNSSQNPLMPSPYVSRQPSQTQSSPGFQKQLESKFPVVSFLNFLSNFSKSIGSSAQSYDKIILMGKQEILKLLPDMGIKNVTFVNQSLDHISKINIESVIKKIGPIPNRCVCLLAFGLSAFARPYPTSANCTKFKCIKQIPIYYFGTPNLSGENMARSFTIHRMSEIEEFVSNMSYHMPTVVLPLFPCKVICDDNSDITKHQATHAITMSESYVVSGSEEHWASYFSLITFVWSNFLKRNHAIYSAPELIQKYLDNQRETLEIKKEVREFTLGANVTIWGSFTLTLIRLMLGVSKIDQPTHSATGQSTITPITPGPSSTGSLETNFKNNIASLLSATESNYVAVKVWDISESVPEKMLYQFFEAVDPQATIQKQSESYIVQLPKGRAIWIVKKLNNYLIGDRIVQASIVGQEDAPIVLNSTQEKFVSGLYNTVFIKWKSTLIKNLVEKYGKESEIAKYKVEFCQGYCWGATHNCSYYHTDYDRRRDPAVFFYTLKLCDQPKYNLRRCVNGDNCTNSHNIFEQMFHPYNLHTLACSSQVKSKCPKQPYCPYAHKYSPEMLFVPSWEDLLLYGAHNTYEFFAGALREYAKISVRRDLKLCLLSTSTITLSVVEKLISERFPHLRNKAISLKRNQTVDTEKYQIFYGSVFNDCGVKRSIFHPNSFGVLIVDGITDIMGHNEARKMFSKFWERIKVTNREWASISKVFISNRYFPSTASTVSNFVGVRLHEVMGIGTSTGMSSFLEESLSKNICSSKRARSPSMMEVLAPKKPRSVSPVSPKSRGSRSRSRTRWWLHSKPRRSSSISRRMSRSPSRRRKQSRSPSRRRWSRSPSRRWSRSSLSRRWSRSPSSRRLSRSPSRRRPARSPSSRRWSRSPSRRKRSRSISRRRSKSRSITRRRRSRSISLDRRSTSKTRQRSRSRSHRRSHSRPKFPPAKLSMTEFLDSKQPRLQSASNTYRQPPKPKMSLSEVMSEGHSKIISGKSDQRGPSISSRLREILDDGRKDFLEAEKELRTAHDDEYEVFQTFPELHPDYEKHHEEFSKIYQAKYGLGLDVNHKEKMFREYWNSKVSMIKFDHWVKRRSELEGEYEVKTSMSKSLKKNDWGPSTSGSNESFSVKGTLDILERLLNEIGVLGPALKPILRSARNLGVDTPEALRVFTDSENLIIINMTMDKIKSLMKSASVNIFPTLSLALDWTYRLLGYAKSTPNKPNLSNLNLEALAKASVGKDSAFILNVIKTAIAYEGIGDVPKEEINNIFLKVCSIHFNMELGISSK